MTSQSFETNNQSFTNSNSIQDPTTAKECNKNKKDTKDIFLIAQSMSFAVNFWGEGQSKDDWPW